ncbi:hypothetical protein [Aurantibacillus circumpalustris]|uniref:hypothetical protein n=1 Tax=Aurantibacillus circumpalustris TaxID=3036359 RepID=UPI00295BFE48|nr:hypothetical protein [Aurantibacillus circumpalustris]
MNCYNCGASLSPAQNHREHIPPKNLFEGFPIAFRETRILVPACYNCNQSYSYADEEFRNLIGIINKRPEAVKLVEKTTRSFFRLDAKLARIIYGISNRMPFAVKFDLKAIEQFHIKNFKGLFYHNYGIPLTSNFLCLAHFDTNFQKEKSQKLVNYLTQNFSWKVSGDESVFRYILQPYRPDHNFDGSDILPSADEKYFICLMSYTKNHAALVLSERK